jgi:hypothetical protein
VRFYHGLDLLAEDCFKRTVFDDAAIFDGVSMQATRQHFKDWRKHALYEEQGSSEEFEAGGPEGLVPSSFNAVRYRFCVQIDNDALQSNLSRGSLMREDDAWLNLVEADWDLEAILAQRAEDRIEGIESGLDPEGFDECIEFFPEIEGCSEENIGWMRVQLQDLVPGFFAKLRQPDMPGYLYVRPPNIAS